MVTPGAAGWRLPVLVVISGLVLIGVLLIVDDGLRPDAESTSATNAIVLETASCGQPGARDTVEVVLDEDQRSVPLNGCGNLVGTVVEVEVTEDGGELVAHLAGTGGSPAGGLDGQLSLLLLVLAAASGSLLVVVVRASQAVRPATGPVDYHVPVAGHADQHPSTASPAAAPAPAPRPYWTPPSPTSPTRISHP